MIKKVDVELIDKAIRFNRELQPVAKSLHHLDEVSCNYGLSKRQETGMTNLMKKAKEIAGVWFGLQAYHQSDPRGASLYIGLDLNASNYTNGICIY